MTEPLVTNETRVAAEWIDDYGHMNMANYVMVCDWGTYGLWEHVNDGAPLVARGGAEYAVVETHVNYYREVAAGDPLRVTTQVLGADDKRFHVFHTLWHAADGFVSATNEVMALGFDLQARALMAFVPRVRARLRALAAAHASLPRPRNAGRSIRTPGAP